MDYILVEKPWGHFERFTHNQNSTVKLLYIKKGESLSLQYHKHREEFWKIIKGNPLVEVGDEKTLAHEGEMFQAKAMVTHRVSAPDDDVVFLEVAIGSFDEEDIVRVEDRYNRSNSI